MDEETPDYTTWSPRRLKARLTTIKTTIKQLQEEAKAIEDELETR